MNLCEQGNELRSCIEEIEVTREPLLRITVTILLQERCIMLSNCEMMQSFLDCFRHRIVCISLLKQCTTLFKTVGFLGSFYGFLSETKGFLPRVHEIFKSHMPLGLHHPLWSLQLQPVSLLTSFSKTLISVKDALKPGGGGVNITS